MPEALYRKYRPQVFADVVGQEPIERTLRNALDHGKVSHAYLFTGPRGTGKTTTARLLAKALLCQQGPTSNPDGTCEDCRLIAEGAHPDVYELDAASRTGVENVREEIISRVQYAPTRGRSKVYIIDEVHMLSTAAFNALLKTLEEPPNHVVFILCTTDPQKVPETIHSRCQRFDFHRIAPEAIVTRLGAICVAEGVQFEGEALDLIAQRAEGGLRNALTSLEQIIAFENGSITLAGAERLLGSIDASDMTAVMSLIGTRNIAGCFHWVADYVETGADLAQFARDMGEHVRDLYVLALSGDEAVLDVPETTRAALSRELQWFGPERASRLLGVLGDLIAELRTSSNPRLSFEIALTRMVRPDSDLTLEALFERIEALESGYSSVAHVLPDAATAREGAHSPVTVETPIRAPQAEAAPSSEAGGERQTASTTVAEAPKQEAPTDAPRSSPAETRTGRKDAVEASKAAIRTEAPSTLEGLANPAALQRVWQAVFAEVKKKKQAHAVLLMNTKVAFDEVTGGFRILFPEEATFAYQNVQRPEVHETLEEAIVKATGSPVPFSIAKADGEASDKPRAVSAELAASGESGAQGNAAQAGAGAKESEAPQAAEPRFSAAPIEEPVYDEPPLSVYENDAPAPGPFVESVAAPSAESDAGQPPAREDLGAAPAGEAEDVREMIRNGFGDDIVFEEIKE